MKKCAICKIEKDLIDFYKDSTKKDGKQRQCIQCYKEYSKKYWQRLEVKKRDRKRCIEKYRLKKGIPLEKPLQSERYGKGCKTTHGYVVFRKTGHPYANKGGNIFEHTWVMCHHLNRPLAKYESVHHKNGIRDDNRLENLELWSKSQPPGQKVEDKIKWCIEFLNEYGYEVNKK